MATIKPLKKIFLSQVAGEIPLDKPIVFWDTCSLIYILTIAVRELFADFQHYKNLLGWIERDEIVSVTSSIVWNEFKDHYSEEYHKAEEDVDKLRMLIRNYASLQQDSARTDLNNLAASMNVIDILEDLELRVWGKTVVIKEERDLADLTHYRVLHKWSPSMVKEQYMDAYIWCTFMSVSQKISEVKKFFMTDNKEDYCVSKRNMTLQEQIASDCTTVGAEILFNIGSLRGKVYQALNPVP